MRFKLVNLATNCKQIQITRQKETTSLIKKKKKELPPDLLLQLCKINQGVPISQERSSP